MLERLLERASSTLSGGEQQAVAIGRTLMANPDLVLLDEVSLALAPVVVRSLYEALPRIVEAGTTVVVVEQDITLALECLGPGGLPLGRSDSLSGVPGELTPAPSRRRTSGSSRGLGQRRHPRDPHRGCTRRSRPGCRWPSGSCAS